VSKVFGIGLPRTGTASLCEALVILGYHARHYPKYADRAKRFDALVDTPICNCFENLDKEYPGSKFILTMRNPLKWLKSCENASKRFKWHNLKPDGRCGPEVYQAHIDLFGTTAYDQNGFLEGYFKHTKRVLEYFMAREDWLIYEVSEGWAPICEFLGKPIPKEPFPHRNKS